MIAGRSLLLGTWRRVGPRLFTGALALACIVFSVNSVRDRLALHEFEGHVASLADVGGGVLFVFRLADCLETAEVVEEVGHILGDNGVAVMGLIIADGLTDQGLRLALEGARERFDHEATSMRGARAFAGRIQTPLVLAVTSNHSVVASEYFGSVELAGVPGLADRLTKALQAEKAL